MPVTDIAIKNSDLVLSTQGRAFWVLDDFSVLSHLTPEVMAAPIALLPPKGATQGGHCLGQTFVAAKFCASDFLDELLS